MPLRAQTPTEDILYYTFEPEIVTNYLSPDRNLGFVRVQVDLMVQGPKALEAVDHHAPLLRNALIELLGRQPGWRVKDPAFREEIRQECLQGVHALLAAETGHGIAMDLLFTKFLY